jgi:hypothetical protein
MKKLINKTQQKIYAIFRTLLSYASKLRISSFVGGQLKKQHKRNDKIIGIPFFYDDTIKTYKQYNLEDYGRNNRTNTFWKNCRKWFC